MKVLSLPGLPVNFSNLSTSWSQATYQPNFFFFCMARKPLVGKGLLVIEASTSHLVELLWTSDQPDAQTST